MTHIKPFEGLGKNDAPIAGGKGASLGEMTQAGISVPPGFVVLAGAFEHFIKETDLVQEIEAILGEVRHTEIHTVEHASESIKSLILSREMPEDIRAEIDSSFKTLGAEYVAVRSSATAEDGVDHAWAGQLESYLNTTEADLIEKVKHCWASLFTPRAIFYRFEKGLHGHKISVAVVVQKMVASEISGIAFSVHPVTEDRNQLIIEAGYGLGEAIVSGQITPDSYVVEKTPRKILDVNVSTQTRGLYRVEGGGNVWHDISEPKASAQVLNEAQILELSELILRIENHYGFPCDIEWAYEAGEFYIVQSRPITTLQSESVSFDIDPSKYHFCGLWKCDLLVDWYWTQWLVPEYAQKIGLPLTDGGVFVINGGNFFVKNEVFDAVRLYIKDIIDSRNTEKLNVLRELTDQIYEATIPEARVLRSKAVSVQTTKDMTELGRKIMFPWCFGYLLSEVADELLVPLASKEGIEAEDIASLIPTLETPLFKAQQELKGIKETLIQKGYWELLRDDSVKAIEVIKNDQDLLSVLNEYATVYGWTSVMNLLGENPTVEEVIEQLTHIGEGTEHENVTRKESDDLAFLIDCATTIAYMRQSGVEHFSMYSRDAIQYLKNVSLQLSLPYKSLINLNRDEIVAALEGMDVKSLIESRKNDVWAIYTVSNGEPHVIDDHGQLEILAQRMIPRADSVQEGEIRGQVGNKGKAQGTVKVIISPEEFSKMEKGDVLVTTMTTPDYVPLMQKASAIVTNIGGLLCHAAIISRELGIPCVIGTKFATQLLKDGNLVEVDADSGVVRIIKSSRINNADYVLTFESQGTKFLFESLVFNHYFKAQQRACFVYSKDGHMREYTSSESLTLMEKEGLTRSSDLTKKTIHELNENITSALKAPSIESLGKVLETYAYLDYAYWDVLFTQQKTQSAENITLVQESKNVIREEINKLYFGQNSSLQKLEDEISARTGIPCADLDWYSEEDFKNLVLLGKRVESGVLTARQKSCVLSIDAEGKVLILTEAAADNYLEEHVPEAKTASDIFKGTVAHGSGVHVGKVTVISRDYSNDPTIMEKQIKDMEQGSILVSENTDPSLIEAFHKAKAVVTDIGGLLSHAAITCREFNIPCVIGVGQMSKIVKTGDLVEVDANTGVVRILPNKTAGESVSDESVIPQIIDPKNYTFIGSYKTSPFGSSFWSSWYVEELGKEFQIHADFSGWLMFQARHVYYHTSQVKPIMQSLQARVEAVEVEYFENLMKRADEELKNALDFSKSIRNEDSISDLTSLIYHSRRILFFWCLGWQLSQVLDEFLRSKAAEYGVPDNEIASHIPHVTTPLVEHQQDLQKIKSAFKAKGLVDNAEVASMMQLVQNDSELRLMCESHIEKYGWVSNIDWQGSACSLEQLLEQVSAVTVGTHITHSISDNSPFKKYEPILRAGSINQYGSEYLSMFAHNSTPFLKSIANKLNMSYEDFHLYLPSEILALLEQKDTNKENHLGRREGNWCVYTESNNTPTIIDNAAVVQKISNLFLGIKKDRMEGELRGDIGNKGKAQGIVKVVYSAKDFEKFSEGNVLVTAMTTPDFIALMQKSAAIVTEMGGLLSHAAITAREIGKPCIIGTKIATQVLKDGDLVEVDADSGVVRLIQ